MLRNSERRAEGILIREIADGTESCTRGEKKRRWITSSLTGTNRMKKDRASRAGVVGAKADDSRPEAKTSLRGRGRKTEATAVVGPCTEGGP